MARARSTTVSKPEIEGRGGSKWIDRDRQQSAAVTVPATGKADVDDPHDLRQALAFSLCPGNAVPASCAEIAQKGRRPPKSASEFHPGRGPQNEEQVPKQRGHSRLRGKMAANQG
jgi:hypothetical protein